MAHWKSADLNKSLTPKKAAAGAQGNLFPNSGRLSPTPVGGLALDRTGTVRAISLLQPWASLVALGLKQLETRSWMTAYRGPLLIHASLGKPGVARLVAEQVPLIAEALARHGLTFDALPRGGIVAACELIGVRRILELGQVPANEREMDPARLPDMEWMSGDYSPGRFAWTLDRVRAVPLVPCRGTLQLWEVPKEVLAQLA